MGAPLSFGSYPRGWFVVAFSADVAAGAVRTVHHFGQDIVLFRTASGSVSAVAHACPHLGAHLGVGYVDGECLRCPVHAWAFDRTGRCVEIPGVKKIPAKASVSAWPVREADGVVLIFHCPRGEAPTWEPPAVPEVGWTERRAIRLEVAGHPQEVAESTVERAHLGPQRRAISAEVASIAEDGPCMRVAWHIVATGAGAQQPGDVAFDVALYGLGLVVATTCASASGLRVRRRICATPIDRERTCVFAVQDIEGAGDAATRAQGETCWQALLADAPNWATDRDASVLVASDGPIGRFRRWARQFHDATPGTSQAVDQRGAQVRLGEWLRRAGEPGERPAPDEARPKPARFASVDAYFETLAARFDARTVGDIEVVFQWVLTGDAPRAQFAEIRGGSLALVDGVHEQPTVTLEMTSADYLRMINGELTGASAFAAGLGKLHGPVHLAMKMQRLFSLERVVH